MGTDLLIIGAGPAGLALAIAARAHALDYEIVEKGALVDSIFRFPRNMSFFTTPELLEIGGLPFVTPYEKPTQPEALRYYRRVSDTYSLKMSLGEKVLDVRGSAGAFEIRTSRATRESRTVAIATGYYDHPNVLGVPGEDLPHVSHYYTEAHGYYRKSVVVVGGRNSAAIAALELYRAGARVTLVHRRPSLSPSVKYWIRPDIDNRIKAGAIDARFETTLVEITRDAVRLRSASGEEAIPADAVLLLTGYHPDTDLLRGAGVEVNPETLSPTHDPQTLETNVRGLYVAGAAVSGRETNKIFIENGRFHGEAIAASVVRRLAGGA